MSFFKKRLLTCFLCDGDCFKQDIYGVEALINVFLQEAAKMQVSEELQSASVTRILSKRRNARQMFLLLGIMLGNITRMHFTRMISKKTLQSFL